MTVHRLRVGLAVAALGTACFTGTAAAQVAGCSYSDCTPQGQEVSTPTTAPTTPTTAPCTEMGGGTTGSPGTGDTAGGCGVLGEGATAGAPGEGATAGAPAEGVLSEGAAAGAPGSVESNSASAPAGSLPFTGGDVAGLALVGGAAIAAGALMIRRSRTQH